MRFLFFLLLLMATQEGFSHAANADSTNKSCRTSVLRNTKFIALPVVFKLPETGWGGGVVGTSTFSFTRDSSFAKPSQVSFGATYTQKKQILFFVPFTIFYDNNRYYLNGDNGWFKYNYNYYGRKAAN